MITRKKIARLPKRTPSRSRNTRVRQAAPKKELSFFKGLDWGRIRVWGVGIVFTLLWAALWSRAYYLQIVRGPDLAEMASRRHMATEQVVGARGSIVDRSGNILALTVDAVSVWVNPSVITEKESTAAALAKLLGIPVSGLNTTLNSERKFVWVARKISPEKAEAVKTAGLKGVYLSGEYARVYPYKNLAGQLIGFVGLDDKGLDGLEHSLDSVLRGKMVRQRVQRDASGRRLVLGASDGSGGKSDLRGHDVRLSIDSNIQFFAEESLKENVDKFGAKWGGCMVVDVPTGEILAWAQYPFFDPNEYGKYSRGLRRNRLAADALEQGSTIKSFLIAAALEEKVVRPDTLIDCEKGRWKLGQFTIHDTHSYAKLPVESILHVSSNIGSAKIGLKLGADKYHSYLARVGFGVRSGLPLSGEAVGILRPAKKWQPIDLATASFGQSFSATMLQMAQAYLCLANDGMRIPLVLVMNHEQIAPHLDADREPRGPERIFSPKTMRDLRTMLREVVEEEGGTGKQARIPGMELGGKTGTAQKADASGKYGSGRVASFVGMIPIENPRYLIVSLLDEPQKNQYGGVVAAPVFRHVALHTMAYHGRLPDTDDPLVRQVAEKLAEKKLKQQGSQKNKAKKQEAAPVLAETARAENARAPIEIVQGIAPGVVGLDVRKAVEVFAKLGIVPCIEGRGMFVSRQQPEAGGSLEGITKCTLWLEEKT